MADNSVLSTDELKEFDLLADSQKRILVEWCSSIVPIRSINTKHTSYGLKHLFNNAPNGFYVTNGAFKKAMLEAGFEYKCVNNSINWFFNISEKSIKAMALSYK